MAKPQTTATRAKPRAAARTTPPAVRPASPPVSDASHARGVALAGERRPDGRPDGRPAGDRMMDAYETQTEQAILAWRVWVAPWSF